MTHLLLQFSAKDLIEDVQSLKFTRKKIELDVHFISHLKTNSR